jgi:FlaA1/EpsC-like NDP-sugar epimerase
MELAEQMIRLSNKDLRVKIIGIRPGEKLSEKLWASNEKTIKTVNPKIWQILKKSVKK